MKAFALLTAAMLFSLIFSATATTVFYEPKGYAKVDGYMDMNLSFIAPSPINYTLVPVMAPMKFTSEATNSSSQRKCDFPSFLFL